MDENQFEHEKSSYGGYVYRQVQKLRKKGLRRGIEVPPLGYELTKPDKPRFIFWIVAAVAAMLFVGALVCLFLLVDAVIGYYTTLTYDGFGDFLANLFNPEYIVASLGGSASLGILAAVFAYGIVLVFVSVAVSIVICLYSFIRDSLYMAKCSKEEFAKGNIISARIFRLIFILAVIVVLFIYFLTQCPDTAKPFLIVVFAALCVALGGLLAVMIIEKIKCAKWFETLDEEKKQDFLAHDKALRRVKSHLKSEKQFWENLGR